MNFMFLVLLLALISPGQIHDILIHIPPSQRSRLDATIKKSKAERSLQQLGIDSSTKNLIEILKMPLPESRPDLKWPKIYAAKVLAERGVKEAKAALFPLVSDPHVTLRVEAGMALAQLDPEVGKKILKKILADPLLGEKSYARVMKVAGALADLGDVSGYDIVVRGLTLEHRKTTAVILLPKFSKLGVDVVPLLIDALEGAAEDLRYDKPGASLTFRWAVIGLGKLEDFRASPKLEAVAGRVPTEYRQLIEQAIRQIQQSDIHTLLKMLESDPMADRRAFAAWSIGERNETIGISALAAALEDKDLEVRLEAGLALTRFHDERGRSFLRHSLQDPDLAKSSIRYMWQEHWPN